MAEAKKFLSVKDVVSVQTRPFKDVYVKRLGGYARVQALSGTQFDIIGKATLDEEGNATNVVGHRARTIIQGWIDPETGYPLFNPTDEREVGNLHAEIINQLYNEIGILSGADPEEEKAILKNSDEAQSDGQPSESAQEPESQSETSLSDTPPTN